MTDGQIKAMFTMLEYIAKQVVEPKSARILQLEKQLRAYKRMVVTNSTKRFTKLETEVEALRKAILQSNQIMLALLPEDQRHEAAAILRDFRRHKTSPK